MPKRSRYTSLTDLTDQELEEREQELRDSFRRRNENLNAERNQFFEKFTPLGNHQKFTELRHQKQLRDREKYVLQEVEEEKRRRKEKREREQASAKPSQDSAMSAAIAAFLAQQKSGTSAASSSAASSAAGGSSSGYLDFNTTGPAAGYVDFNSPGVASGYVNFNSPGATAGGSAQSAAATTGGYSQAAGMSARQVQSVASASHTQPTPGNLLPAAWRRAPAQVQTSAVEPSREEAARAVPSILQHSMRKLHRLA
eukprot:TRINITY_DN15510_c0_g1_i1.p1 TRINITY_DN15510_c0_g1~~TRINITY_DN15510_c0_g1_i1.p1  ORF type:complete len:272 (+),score=64.08 TRINITY_DN15510_c0_g1_i1:53-817(+)